MRIFLFLLFLSSQLVANGWGKTGHRTVGEIASHYLTNKTKKAIEKLIGGQSLAYVSNYADEIKSDPSYKKYTPWHYANIPLAKEYEEIVPSEEGDILQAINQSVVVLKDKTATLEEQRFALKFLVHLVGDLHQPLHMGRKEDKGGNKINVKWFGKNSNLHRVWDSEMIESYQMSYSELAQNLLSIYQKSNRNPDLNLNPLFWAKESQRAVRDIYRDIEKNDRLGYAYSYKYFSLVQERLYLAGRRLAELLNHIFDS